MAYTPLNPGIFNAAYQGAVSGSFAAGRFPLNTNPAAPAQVNLTAACFAFAKAYDTLRGAGASTCCEEEMVRQACAGTWATRAGQSLVQADYNKQAQGIAAGVDASLALLASEGVACTCEGGGSSITAVNPIQNANPTVADQAPNGYYGSKTESDPVNLTTVGGKLVIDVFATATLGASEGPVFGTLQVSIDGVLVGFALSRLIFDGDTAGIGGQIVVEGVAAGDHRLAVELTNAAPVKLTVDDTCTVCVTEFA